MREKESALNRERMTKEGGPGAREREERAGDVVRGIERARERRRDRARERRREREKEREREGETERIGETGKE